MRNKFLFWLDSFFLWLPERKTDMFLRSGILFLLICEPYFLWWIIF